MIRTILVAVDGSDHAKKALALACDLAQKYNARMILVHVHLSNARSDTLRGLANKRALTKDQRQLLDNYEIDMQLEIAKAGGNTGFVTIPPPRELVEIIGRQIVDRAKTAATKAGIKKVTAIVADGDPADIILDYAAKEKASMIVLGSRGLSDVKGFFLGSVSHKVSSRAACSCVTVK